MRKLTIFIFVAMLMTAGSVYSQDQRGMPRNEDKYKELLTYRIVEITDALNLELNSEKGRTLIDLINNKSDAVRRVFKEKGEKQRSLYQELKNENINVKLVEELILDIERLHGEIYAIHLEYDKNLKAILSPVERAHLYVAEERFRSRLQRAMQDHKKGPGEPRRDRKE